MLLKLATFGALGYVGYMLYEKNQMSPAGARTSSGAPADPGPMREGADTDGAGSGGFVQA